MKRAAGLLGHVRVVDLTWMLSGPYGTRILADLGAQVIKVESLRKVDGVRVYGPWKGHTPTPPEGGGWYASTNRGKLSIAVDLSQPEGRALLDRLLQVSDMLFQNMRHRGLEKLGLTYDRLGRDHPHLIMVSMGGFGSGGPYRDYPTFGPLMESLAGLTHLIGQPQREPVGFGTPWADYLAGLHAAAAALAALEQRWRTGKGQHIDISQMECSVVANGVALLQQQVSGKAPEAKGNRGSVFQPQGCYRCKGEDRWCMVSVQDDGQWRALCDIMGRPELASDPRYATASARASKADEVDTLIESWTAGRTAPAVLRALQQRGVPAGLAQDVRDLLENDPQLRSRGFYRATRVPRVGMVRLEGAPFRMNGRRGPFCEPSVAALGEHTDNVLHGLLGMSKKEVGRLRAVGVLR